MNKYPNLTSPIKLGKVTFRNRIFSAPMGATDITADCCPGPRTQGFYELRAKGGAAAVTVSELVVHPETDASHMLHLDLETVVFSGTIISGISPVRDERREGPWQMTGRSSGHQAWRCGCGLS